MGTTTTTNKGLIKPDGNEPRSNWPTQWGAGADTVDLTINKIQRQIFTSSGTWNKPTGLRYAEIESVGSGGGGGGSAATAAGECAAAAGGGAGAVAKKLMTAAALGSSETVTVSSSGGAGGAAGDNVGIDGGDSSFGAHCIADGGHGGDGGTAGSAYLHEVGGVGGTISNSTGDLRLPGTDGSPGIAVFGASSLRFSGAGGANYYGNAGAPATSSVGEAGTGFGAGGSGAASAASAVARAGGSGAPGLIIVTEYISSAS